MFSRVGVTLFSMGLILWALFCYPLFVEIYHYSGLTASTPADSIEWTIQPIHDELWRPIAQYKYTVNHQIYQKNEFILGGRYRNPYAANAGVEELRDTYKIIWYDPSHPERSTLEKYFPIKKIIYAFMSLGLLIYGVWLATYLSIRILQGPSNKDKE